MQTKDFVLIADGMSELVDSYEFQGLLVASGIEFLEALLEEDLIKYQEIWEVYDRLGVFNNKWQMDIVNKLSSMNGKLENIDGGLIQLNSSVLQFEKNFKREINQLKLESAKGWSLVANGLDNIGKKLDVSNAISAFNAYPDKLYYQGLSLI